MIKHATYLQLYELIKCSLWNIPPQEASFSSLTAPEWSKLLDIARSQGTYGIISGALSALPPTTGLPQEIKIQYDFHLKCIEANYFNMCITAGEIARECHEKHIPIMALKGISLSAMYPVPALRECDTHHFYLFGHTLERGRNRKSTLLRRNGIAIQYHTSFFHSAIPKIDRILQKYLSAMTSMILLKREPLLIQIEKNTTYRTNILLPIPNFNAIYLLRDALSNLVNGEMTIRHLCDWACFLARHGREVDWDIIKRILREADIIRFSDGFTYLACKYMGMPLEHAIPLLGSRIRQESPGHIGTPDKSLEALANLLLAEIITDCKHPIYRQFTAFKRKYKLIHKNPL